MDIKPDTDYIYIIKPNILPHTGYGMEQISGFTGYPFLTLGRIPIHGAWPDAELIIKVITEYHAGYWISIQISHGILDV